MAQVENGDAMRADVRSILKEGSNVILVLEKGAVRVASSDATDALKVGQSVQLDLTAKDEKNLAGGNVVPGKFRGVVQAESSTPPRTSDRR